MSPEQAIGEPVDTRTDIWAFGCVVFEMLAGRQAFEGRTPSEAVAAVLKTEPDWRALPDDTPEAVRRLLERCLRKDAARRLRHIADAGLELEEPSSTAAARIPAQAAPPVRRWLTWAAVVGVVAGGVWVIPRPGATPEVRLEFSTPPTIDPSLAVSPDGRTVAFVGLIDGRRGLWLRRLDVAEARAVPGSDNASAPFWSPDGRAIGFFADGRLNIASLADGSVRAVVSGVAAPGGATLNSAGVLLYSPNPGVPLSRLSITGGTPAAATRFEVRHRLHAFPSFLPDGRHFLFFVAAPPEERGIHLGELDRLDSRRLLNSEGPAVFAAASGCLFFVRDGKLVAQPFDPGRLELGPEAIAIDDRAPLGNALAASPAGPVVYRTPTSASAQRQLVWLDRTGTETHRVVYTDTMPFGPALSRDGRRVAVFRDTAGNVDLWTYDVPRGTWDRVTSDAGDDIHPLWSSDGRRMFFGSRRGTLPITVVPGEAISRMDLYSLRLDDGPGAERLELSTPQPKLPTDWSPDDRVVLFNSLAAESGMDIAALRLDGTQRPFDVVKTPANEQHAQFSPDGRWIAYQSDRTGDFEIYVRPFPGPGADVRVSSNGGAQPRWNPRGEELFYIAADDRLMSVPIAERSGAPEPGTPTALFVTTVGSMAPNTNRQQYSVSADGRGFLMNSLVDSAGASPVTVILNWMPPR